MCTWWQTTGISNLKVLPKRRGVLQRTHTHIHILRNARTGKLGRIRAPDQHFGAALLPVVLLHDSGFLLFPIVLVQHARDGLLKRVVKLELVSRPVRTGVFVSEPSAHVAAHVAAHV